MSDIYQKHGYYFFRLDGQEHGPFDSEHEAADELEDELYYCGELDEEDEPWFPI